MIAGNLVVGLAAALFIIGCYFIPTMIANSRHHPNASGVLVVNLLAGWTLIGWIVALVMASSGPSQGASLEAERKCPFCAENIKAEAIVCRYCQHNVEPLSGLG